MMATGQITDSRILIVEDEYLLADEARSILADVGVEVLGPVATVADARAIVLADYSVDAVLLDVNLGGEMAFDLADLLRSREIPFAFVTGYDRDALPTRFSDVTTLQKPVGSAQLKSLADDLAASHPTRLN
jgi:DNA-binding response OmpR family regulator